MNIYITKYIKCYSFTKAFYYKVIVIHIIVLQSVLLRFIYINIYPLLYMYFYILNVQFILTEYTIEKYKKKNVKYTHARAMNNIRL